eukprot:2888401-Rhodomonas_salina.2
MKRRQQTRMTRQLLMAGSRASESERELARSEARNAWTYALRSTGSFEVAFKQPLALVQQAFDEGPSRVVVVRISIVLAIVPAVSQYNLPLRRLRRRALLGHRLYPPRCCLLRLENLWQQPVRLQSRETAEKALRDVLTGCETGTSVAF